MSLLVKICGINAPEAMEAAIGGGADMVGLVFYPPSPRFVTTDQAASLAATVPGTVAKVGLFVDPSDAALGQVLDQVELDMLQLHGSESPQRVREIKERFGLPAMKAIPVASIADVLSAHNYEAAADRLLFDARPPPDMAGALPGGNALRFDWELLRDKQWALPWMLSGGLTAENVAEAAMITAAPGVDVSSGVEDRPGHKDPAKIKAFLTAAKRV